MQIMQIFGLPTWQEAVRGILVFICQFLYKFIAWIYELFITVARVNILSSEKMTQIYNRVTMILTIVMVFYITFEFVKYVVQPDTISDKEKGVGNMAFKIIFVILLIAFVPRIFSMAYELQGKIIDNQILPKVILGKKNINMSTYGRGFSADILSVFYKVNEEVCKGCDAEAVVNFNLNRLRQEGDLKYLDIGINDTVKSSNPANGKEEETTVIDFDGLPAVIVGGAIVYILALYSIDVGTRYAQLIFLQIISPIAIMGYLTPKKDNMFSKWVKQCITTYINLFIRIAIIYFVLLICQELGDSYRAETLFAGLGTISKSIHAFAYIALIMGLLVFASKAPKMLQELFPSMSGGAAGIGFGLGAKDRIEPTAKALKRATRVFGGAAGMATGAVAGAASGLAQGFRRSNSLNKAGNKKGIGAGIFGATQGLIGGAVGGATRGLVNGGKKGNVLKNATAGAKNQIKANQRFGNRQENGYGLIDQIGDMAKSAVGARSRVEMQEAAKAPITRHDEALKKVADTRSKIEDRALSKLKEKGGTGGEKAQEYYKEQQRLKDLQENNEVRSREFRVGKFNDDKKAQAEYEKAVTNAKAAVRKSDFIDPSTQQFDRDGYEKALASAAATVKVSDYSVAYATEAEAQQAYKNAVKAKTDDIDRNMYATDDDYNAALKAAASTVNADMYIKGYATQAEADKALGDAITKQIKIVNDAKDKAVYEYVAKSGDGAIDSMLDTLAVEIKEYNKTASAEVITEENPDGTPVLDANGNPKTYTRKIKEIDQSAIISNFEAFSDYVKSGEINQAQNRNTNKLVKINSEIERIKRQQSGSGINEGNN